MSPNLTRWVVDKFQTKFKSIDSFGKDQIHVEGLLLFLEPIGHLPSQFWELK